MTKPSLQHQIDELKRDKLRTHSIIMAMSERISEIEHLVGIAPASPIRSGDLHIKTVAGMLDCSISGVHFHAREGRLTKVKRGRKTFIRVDAKLHDACSKIKK